MYKWLGHVIKGEIVQGTQHARITGYPTINIFAQNSVSLAKGTYAVKCKIKDKLYSGLGPRFPEKNIFESHILEQIGNQYSNAAQLRVLYKIRDNIKYSDPEVIKQQIVTDIRHRRAFPVRVMIFGTFDGLHAGHLNYFNQARFLGDTTICVVARDITVKKIKGRLPRFDLGKRIQNIKNTGLVDLAIAGHENDYYKRIKEHNPEVIALGYDQSSFDKGLQPWLIKNNLSHIAIVRLKPYHPQIYKSSILNKKEIENE